MGILIFLCLCVFLPGRGEIGVGDLAPNPQIQNQSWGWVGLGVKNTFKRVQNKRGVGGGYNESVIF